MTLTNAAAFRLEYDSKRGELRVAEANASEFRATWLSANRSVEQAAMALEKATKNVTKISTNDTVKAEQAIQEAKGNVSEAEKRRFGAVDMMKKASGKATESEALLKKNAIRYLLLLSDNYFEFGCDISRLHLTNWVN